MDRWAAEYEVTSLLEGPIDGMAGIRGVHGAGLARAGVKVVAAVTGREAAAEVARGSRGGRPRAPRSTCGCSTRAGAGELPHADMVLVYHALPFVADWRAYLGALGRLARKVLVVATCNPDNWGAHGREPLGTRARPGGVEDRDAGARALVHRASARARLLRRPLVARPPGGPRAAARGPAEADVRQPRRGPVRAPRARRRARDEVRVRPVALAVLRGPRLARRAPARCSSRHPAFGGPVRGCPSSGGPPTSTASSST